LEHSWALTQEAIQISADLSVKTFSLFSQFGSMQLHSIPSCKIFAKMYAFLVIEEGAATCITYVKRYIRRHPLEMLTNVTEKSFVCSCQKNYFEWDSSN
jgi:hypothetical protein